MIDNIFSGVTSRTWKSRGNLFEYSRLRCCHLECPKGSVSKSYPLAGLFLYFSSKSLSKTGSSSNNLLSSLFEYSLINSFQDWPINSFVLSLVSSFCEVILSMSLQSLDTSNSLNSSCGAKIIGELLCGLTGI